MVEFQLVSDLHLTYDETRDRYSSPTKHVHPEASILILAGDIGSLYHPKALKIALQELKDLFNTVLYVPGNHEYYVPKDGDNNRLTMKQLTKRLYALEEISGLHILDRRSVRIGNVCIAGCTLWSDVSIKVPRYIVRIHGITDTIYKSMYRRDLLYLQKMANYCKARKHELVVVTHYSPSLGTLKGCKRKDKLSSLYASNLDYLFDDPIVTWCYGHTHHNTDTMLNGVRLVSNQLGRPTDDTKDFSSSCLISLSQKAKKVKKNPQESKWFNSQPVASSKSFQLRT